jgi:VanZ family protein
MSAFLLVPDLSKVLFIPSNLPEELKESSLPLDKIAHGAGYFVLTILGTAAFAQGRSAVSILLVATAAALHGAAIEIAQCFVPMRFGGVADWLADLAGIAVALLVLLLAMRRTPATSDHLA